jgi:hypothetical protein
MTNYIKGSNKAGVAYFKILFHRLAAESDKIDELLQSGSTERVWNPTPLD